MLLEENDLTYILETRDGDDIMSIALSEESYYMDLYKGSRLIIEKDINERFVIDITKEEFKENRLTKPELKAIREYLSNFGRDGDVLPKINENGITLSLNRDFDIGFDTAIADIPENATYKTMSYAKMIGYSIVNILKEHVLVLNHQDNENKEAWFKAY